MAAVRSTPWWNWIGGPLGATVVLAGAALISRLGATACAAAFVGGQLVFSLLLDHYGWMDLPQESITAGRLAGAALVFAGMLMVRYL
jgi:transporter family-2 protein